MNSNEIYSLNETIAQALGGGDEGRAWRQIFFGQSKSG